MTAKEFSQTALSFPNTAEAQHFDRIAFKVIGRRIFATLHEESETVNIMLSIADQHKFCVKDRASAYPVPNKWGEQGWTTFELPRADKDIVFAALEAAYNDASKTKIKNNR